MKGDGMMGGGDMKGMRNMMTQMNQMMESCNKMMQKFDERRSWFRAA